MAEAPPAAQGTPAAGNRWPALAGGGRLRRSCYKPPPTGPPAAGPSPRWCRQRSGAAHRRAPCWVLAGLLGWRTPAGPLPGNPRVPPGIASQPTGGGWGGCGRHPASRRWGRSLAAPRGWLLPGAGTANAGRTPPKTPPSLDRDFPLERIVSGGGKSSLPPPCARTRLGADYLVVGAHVIVLSKVVSMI